MKRIILLVVLVAGSLALWGQNQEPPFKRFPTVPPVKLLLADSASFFTKENYRKNKPVMIMFFSPGCDHCQHETEEIMKRKDDFKDIQIVMCTLAPLWEMNAFYKEYHLAQLPDVVVGRDFQYVLPTFYQIRNFPYLAFYDRKQHLISTFEGTLSVDKILEAFGK